MYTVRVLVIYEFGPGNNFESDLRVKGISRTAAAQFTGERCQLIFFVRFNINVTKLGILFLPLFLMGNLPLV
jgi:hypothetical protein